jgi:hypothetical protein
MADAFDCNAEASSLWASSIWARAAWSSACSVQCGDQLSPAHSAKTECLAYNDATYDMRAARRSHRTERGTRPFPPDTPLQPATTGTAWRSQPSYPSADTWDSHCTARSMEFLQLMDVRGLRVDLRLQVLHLFVCEHRPSLVGRPRLARATADSGTTASSTPGRPSRRANHEAPDHGARVVWCERVRGGASARAIEGLALVVMAAMMD